LESDWNRILPDISRDIWPEPEPRWRLQLLVYNILILSGSLSGSLQPELEPELDIRNGWISSKPEPDIQCIPTLTFSCFLPHDAL